MPTGEMGAPSAGDLLVLHAVRVLGYATTARVAGHARLPRERAEELLADAQAGGRVAWTRYFDDGGWSMTESGKAHGERLLAAELDAAGARAEVAAVLAGFGPSNALVAAACTRWQLTEMGVADPPADLTGVLADLRHAAEVLADIEARLSARLARCAGYHARFVTAVARAGDDPAWVNAIDRDSAHRVWFELHEDLRQTLAIPRTTS